jgi:NAD(P)-dependent dehydrogenase (short-subunit alcohol dehydrogenase family)
LAREGAKVVVTDLDNPGGQTVVDKIGNAGGEAIFVHQDVSIEESRPGVIEATERALRAAGRYGRQRRHRNPVQGCRNVIGRLVATNCGEPRWRFSFG